MNDRDVLNILKERSESSRSQIGYKYPATNEPRSFPAKTFSEGSYPTNASRFYACHPSVILGDETEGATGTREDLPGVIYAYNIGGSVPPQNTVVMVHSIEYRFVFEY